MNNEIVKKLKLLGISSSSQLIDKEIDDWRSVKFIEIQNEEPLKRECIHFLEVLRGQSPNTDGKEGLDVIKVISQVSSEANFKN